MRKTTTSTTILRKLLVVALFVALAVLVALPAGAAPGQTTPDLNAGASWNGWTYHGNAQDPGVWGDGNFGAGAADYEIYTTHFIADGTETVPPGVQGSSAVNWTAGDEIIGVGIVNLAGTVNEQSPIFFKFDPDANSYFPASAVGATDGQTSGGSYADEGDFTMQINGDYNYLGQVNVNSVYGPRSQPKGTSGAIIACQDRPLWTTSWQTTNGIDTDSPGGDVIQIFLNVTQANCQGTPLSLTDEYNLAVYRNNVEAAISTVVPATVGPEIAEAVVCDEATVDIAVNNVSDLYGYEFKVLYDDSLVSAVGAFQYGWFDTNASGQSVTGWKGNCANGVCKFARTETYPDAAVSGSGVVASVDFTSLLPAAPASFDVQVVDLILTDKDGFQITPAEAGSIQVEVCGNATVSGTISLQGRLVPNGHDFSVTLTGPYGTFTAPPTIDQTNGTYTVSGVKYTSGGTNYAIQADHSLYLKNAKDPLLVNGDLTGEDTRLLGGDANNNGAVGIGDLSCIGTDFGTANTDACGAFPNSTDINNDTVVNIQDLAIAGGNFSLDDDPPLPW